MRSCGMSLTSSVAALSLDDTDGGDVSYHGLDQAVIERSDSQFPRPIDGEPTPDAWLEPLPLMRWFDRS